MKRKTALQPRMSGSDLQNSRYLQARTTQLLAQRHFQSAINCFDQAIRLHGHANSDHFLDIRHFVHSTMQCALEGLRQTYSLTDTSTLLRLLHQLEKAISTIEARIVAIDFCDLYNSLAVAYRHLPNPPLARSFWEKALNIAQRFPEAAGRRAALCLSLCAVMTELKEHEEALKYAQKGLALALERLKAKHSGDVVTMVAAGYHNVAVQEERLQHYDKALENYKKAVNVIETRGDERHIAMLSDLKRSLRAASRPNSRTQSPLMRPKPPDKPLSKGANRPQTSRTLYRRDCFSVIHSYAPTRNTSFLQAPEDDDIAELEEKGLLEFTRDEEKEARPRRLRGKRRISLSSRDIAGRNSANSRQIVSLQTSLHGSPQSIIGKQELQIQLEEAELSWEQSPVRTNLPESSPEPLYKTELMVKPTNLSVIKLERQLDVRLIVRIQAWARGCRARYSTKLLAKRANTVVHRTCIRGPKGKVAIGVVTEEQQRYRVVLTAVGEFQPYITRYFPKNAIFPALERIASEPAAALKLQSMFRGHSARLQLQRLRKAKRLGKEELYRTVIRVDSAFVICLLRRDSAGLSVLVEPLDKAEKPWEIPVPAKLQQLPYSDIPAKVLKSSEKYSSPQASPRLSQLTLPISTSQSLHQGKSIRLDEIPSFLLEKQTTNSSDSSAFPQFVKSSGHIKRFAGFTPTSQTIPSPVHSLGPEETSSALRVTAVLPISREKAAVRLQIATRRWLACRQFAYLRKRSKLPLLYRGFYSVAKPAISLVSMWKLAEEIEIKCEPLGVTMRLNASELPILGLREPNKYADLATRLYVQDGILAIHFPLADMIKYALVVQKWTRGYLARCLYKSLKGQTKRRLVLAQRKAAGAEIFHVSIYQLEEKVQIEAFKLYEFLTIKYHQQSVYYTNRELQEMYGSVPTFDVIFDDIDLTPHYILLRPRSRQFSHRNLEPLSPLSPRPPLNKRDRSPLPSEPRFILRTSLKLDARLWVVTASINEDLMEFKAFCSGCQEPLSTDCPVNTLCEKVGLTDVIPVSMIAINYLLRLESGELALDFAAKVPNVHLKVAFIQACIRGFLVRRRLGPINKGNLLACKVTIERDEEWVLYAYRDVGAVRIEAVQRGLIERVEIFISDAIFVRFPPNLSHKRVIESFIFPKLTIESAEDDRPQLCMSNSSQVETLFEKHKDKIKVISSAPTVFINCKDQAINDLIEQGRGENASLNRQNALLVNPIVYSRSSGEREKRQAVGFSALAELNKDVEMLAKREIEGNGISYQAAVYKVLDGYKVELLDASSGERLALHVPAEYTSTEDAEELLTRAQVGPKGVTLSPSHVLYQRRHYISDRYYHVAISAASQGLSIAAYDPVRKSTLRLDYKRTSPGQMLETESALAEIVSRLQVQGEATLVYV